MTKYLMAALFVAVASAVLALSFPAEAQLQETTTTIVDSRLAPEIERDGQIKVLISLRDLDELMAVPIAEWTEEMVLGIDWDLRARHAQEVQANVRSALGPEDATEVNGFETMPALGANITASGLEKLRNHPDVVAIGASALGSLSLSEAVPLIEADTVHAAGYDGSGINVAVLDSGIDTDDPDLLDSIVDEICFPTWTACGPPLHPAEDVNGHGTWVSGVITSNGTTPGVPKGIAPEAGIYAYRIQSSKVPIADAVAAALEDIRIRGYLVDFVNMSFTLESEFVPEICTGVYPEIETEIVFMRIVGGVVSFAASGNHAIKSGLPFPACAPSVVSVGAVYDQAFGSKTWTGVCTTRPRPQIRSLVHPTRPTSSICWLPAAE